MRTHSGRLARIGAVTLVAALAGVGPFAAAAFAGGNEPPEAVATLQIDADNVEVRKAGKDDFKAAKDEQQVNEGDTIRTDATGKAEVQYDDQSYTRLDENTTFTIVSLTDDEGNRQVEGSLDTGRTWNRAEGLTESESFEQSGAGATAAVQGTAFLIECTSPTECRYVAAVDITDLTGDDGEFKQLGPLDTCGSDTGDLCDGITKLSTDDPLFQVMQDHLLRDLLEHGFGPGPFPTSVSAIVVVEDGEVVSVTPNPTNPSTPPPPPPAPVIDANPVNIQSVGDPTPGQSPGPGTTVMAQDDPGNDVTFTLQVTNPGGGTFWVVFVGLPDPSFGQLLVGATPVDTTTQYAPDTVFRFDPVQIEPVCTPPAPSSFADCYTNGDPSEGPQADAPQPLPYPSPVTEGPVQGSVQWSDEFSFQAVNDQGGASPVTTVELVVVDDICTSGTESHPPGADDFVSCP